MEINQKNVATPPRKISSRLNAWIFKYHRWLGVISCVAVMLWGASGVMHPIMSRLNPQATHAMPPPMSADLHGALTPAQVLTHASIGEIAGLRVIGWGDASYYQVSLPGWAERRYFEVNSGVELPDGDAKFATYLARHFIGDEQSKVSGSERLDVFDNEYMSINRLLPVYRINFERDDGMRAYVETSPPRLSALVDDRKAVLGWIFRVMHNWEFMSEWDGTRITLISLLLGLTLLSAVSGIWMYVFMWRKQTLRQQHVPLRRWHRGVGIAVSISALLFVVSAEWHLLGSEKRGLPRALNTVINADELGLPDMVRHGSWSQIALVQMEGKSYFYLSPAKQVRNENASAISEEHNHQPSIKTADGQKNTEQPIYVRADTGEVLPDLSRDHAVWLAGQYSWLYSEHVTAVARVNKFEGEYGFFNKRLPVWRVDYATPDHASYYVETSSGALAAVVRDSGRMEGWSFSYLHKFHWLDFAGKDVRDFIMAVFGFGNMLIAILGLWMFLRRYRKAASQ